MANRHLTACAHSSAGQPASVLSPLDVFLIAEHARRAVHLIEHARRQAAVASDTMAFEALGLAAAMLARAAIDTRLNELLLDCPEADRRLQRCCRRRMRPTIGERAIALKKSGMFNLATQRDLIRLASIGGVAAHNDGVQLPEVIDLLAGAAAFVERNPTFTESRGLPK